MSPSVFVYGGSLSLNTTVGSTTDLTVGANVQTSDSSRDGRHDSTALDTNEVAPGIRITIPTDSKISSGIQDPLDAHR